VRLRLSVTRLARRLRQQTAEGLTPSQGSALASIERHRSLTPSELAAIERIQRPTATRILSNLADAGLVTRQRDAADGRSAWVTITRPGTNLLARGRNRKNAYLARRLERLSSEELHTLERAAELIDRLIEDEQ
jgi:DNA-binding MarR family transcriptional regulator